MDFKWIVKWLKQINIIIILYRNSIYIGWILINYEWCNWINFKRKLTIINSISHQSSSIIYNWSKYTIISASNMCNK